MTFARNSRSRMRLRVVVVAALIVLAVLVVGGATMRPAGTARAEEPTRTVWILKEVINIWKDETWFDFTADNGAGHGSVPETSTGLVWNSVSPDAHVVEELVESGYTSLGWKIITGTVCGLPPVGDSPNQYGTDATAEIPPGNGDVTVCFFNSKDGVIVETGPDLAAEKYSGIVGGKKGYTGYGFVPLTFDWTIGVWNMGDAPAVFAGSDLIFRDDLPPGPTYGTNLVVTGLGDWSVNGHDEFEDLACSLSGGSIRCQVAPTAVDGDVRIPPGARFEIKFTVTPHAAGTLQNPPAGGDCAVDPDDQVYEPAPDNVNTCGAVMYLFDFIRDLRIKKSVVGAQDDSTSFDVRIDDNEPAILFSQGVPAQTTVDWREHTVTESALTGYTSLGWKLFAGSEEISCDSTAEPHASGSGATARIPVRDPEVEYYYPITLCFYNKKDEVAVAGRGTLIIEKVEDLNGNGIRDPGENLVDWEVEVIGPEPEFQSGKMVSLPGGNLGLDGIEPGAYTIHEATGIAGYKPIGSITIVVEVPDGGEAVARFFNQPLGGLLIKKVNDGGASSTQFKADIEGGNQDLTFSEQTASEIQALANGAYTVTEDAASGYDYLGWTVLAGDAACPATPANSSAEASVGLSGTETKTLCFYNRKQVTIRVHKIERFLGGQERDGEGWGFELNGCGVHQTGTTDGSGDVAWTGLPPALGCSYTISENGRDGWEFENPGNGRVTVTPGPGADTSVTFVNRGLLACRGEECAVTLPQPATPAPTRTVEPTPTPTKPVATETVAGARTPGSPGGTMQAQATPAAPSAGSGSAAPGGGGNFTLALAGFLIVAGGAALFATEARKRR
ncbi:MAG: hypothetical protein HS107_06630 [Thermoflexaceae bacterium]|nr:hypothetical protein [Thermoflexaceae bacterium]